MDRAKGAQWADGWEDRCVLSWVVHGSTLVWCRIVDNSSQPLAITMLSFPLFLPQTIMADTPAKINPDTCAPKAPTKGGGGCCGPKGCGPKAPTKGKEGSGAPTDTPTKINADTCAPKAPTKGGGGCCGPKDCGPKAPTKGTEGSGAPTDTPTKINADTCAPKAPTKGGGGCCGPKGCGPKAPTKGTEGSGALNAPPQSGGAPAAQSTGVRARKAQPDQHHAADAQPCDERSGLLARARGAQGYSTMSPADRKVCETEHLALGQRYPDQAFA